MTKRHLASLTALLGLLMANTASGVPTKVTYTGHLEDSGQPVDGPISVVFDIYDAPTAGTVLWTELFASVKVEGGFFTADLGHDTPLTATVFDGQTRWLQITVNGNVMSPRVAMDSVPYAIRSGTADSVGSLAAADVQARVTGQCAAGSAIRLVNADGTVTCETVGGGAGTKPIASAFNTTYVDASSGSWATLLQVSVAAPKPGTVALIGSSKVRSKSLHLLSPTKTCLIGWTTSPTGAPTEYQEVTLSNGDGTTATKASRNKTVSVTGSEGVPGTGNTVTFYLRGKAQYSNDACEFHRANGVAIYQPH